MAGTRALFDHGLTTPRKMADATWERRTRILNEAGYARDDESTSRYLEDSAGLLLDRWHGDLRELREAADGDADTAVELLGDFKGIGPAGAQMFVREVQGVWPELAPFVDGPSGRGAERLGLPTSARSLRRLVDSDSELVDLVAALVRSGMAHDEDDIRDAAPSS